MAAVRRELTQPGAYQASVGVTEIVENGQGVAPRIPRILRAAVRVQRVAQMR